MNFNKFTVIVLVAKLCFISEIVNAACDCGSTSKSSPCTGKSISVVVDAGTPNGGTAKDAVFKWNFNSGGADARCGQFANGDYWVAPASGKSNVTITSITTTSPGKISADVDPVMESMGLLDGSESYGNYNSSENIIPNLPTSLSGIKSVVAAIQRNESIEGNCGTSAIRGECADAYNVVTVLSSVPENAGSTVIRPNITGETKELLTLSDFNFSQLPSKSFLNGTDAVGFEKIRLRWSHSTEIFGLIPADRDKFSEGGRAFRSHILIDDYGGGTARQFNDDLMVMFSGDNTLEEKLPALAAMLSYGLDLYHTRFNGGVTRYWGVGATQNPGRFLPPVLLSALAVSSSYKNNLSKESAYVYDSSDDGPHELGQVHPGENGPVWGDIPNKSGTYVQGSYWSNLWKSQCYDGATGTCTTNIGAKNAQDPYGYIDGPANKPGTSYMKTSLGVQRSFVAAMLIMPEIRQIVNFDRLIEYVFRVNDYGIKTSGDLCVTPDSRESSSCDAYRNQGCKYFGVTWGPENPDDANSDCIKTATPPYTKVGRFLELDGGAMAPSYTSSQVESNWKTIAALYSVTAEPPVAVPQGFSLTNE